MSYDEQHMESVEITVEECVEYFHWTVEACEEFLGMTPDQQRMMMAYMEMAGDPLENTRQCVLGVFDSWQWVLLILVLCSFAQGCLTRILIPRGYCRLHDILLVLLGVVTLQYGLSQTTTVLIAVLYALMFVALKLSFGAWKHSALLSCAFSVVFLLGCQQLLEASVFVSFRGVLMIQIMKSVSFAFDFPQNVPNSSLLTYLLNPATVAFGPFLSYGEFAKNGGFWNGGFRACAKSLMMFATALLFLFSSSCVLQEFVLSWLGSHWLLEAFLTAMSFRHGHYFVCYLSFALCLLAGVDGGEVTDWRMVELPRSMVDVVVFWNVPMNKFLHKCVFDHMHKYGRSLAVMATFLASSLLHGFNFQLTAVLLSLGFYSVAEHQFRMRLSRRMNACVKARKCREEGCSHAHKSLSLRTALVNFAFSALAMFHLIYLGMVFDQAESQQSGYSMAHTLGKWAQWKFSSHAIALAMLLLGYTVL